MEINQKKRDKIVADHPHLFKDCQHFECGDGWLGIIETLADKLEACIIRQIELNPDTADQVVCACCQVKEKYGGLRFYMCCETDEMSDLIEEAEKQSLLTCENCGSPARLNKGPWFSCLCKECECK